MGVDRHRVCELYAAGPDVEGSGSGYRIGDRLVLTARHVIAPALDGTAGSVLVRPAGAAGWMPARVEWQDADADAALIAIEDESWRAPAEQSVLRWGEITGSDPVPCAAVGFPWASARPDRMRDTAHVYGQVAPLGQLRQGRLDLDVVSASPSARSSGSPWAGMSGAGVIADNHLAGLITVDPARYAGRLVAVPVGRLLADPAFRARLAYHRVPAEAEPAGASWYLQLPGELTVSLAPAYQPVSRRFRPGPATLLRPEHGLVPFLGRQPVLDQMISWCQGPPGTPVLLMTGGGGSGKTRLGRQACVQMIMAGWDAGFADDQRRDGAATTRLQRQTLLVIDNADLRTSLISSLIDYLRWDDSGPPVGLLLLARAAGAWWNRLIRQQELEESYAVLDLDQYPVPLADRAEHFRRASIAFAAYGRPEVPPAEPPPAAELDDPAYAEPLLIHIAALLRTSGTPGAASPPGLGEDRGQPTDLASDQQRPPVRQMLLRGLCEQERSRWYQLGQNLAFNPDLRLAEQIVALATLTAAGDEPSAISLLAAVPNQAEVTRIGAQALVIWAHQLYSGPSYWNPLRPDLLAEQHLADTENLATLAIAAARRAAGQDWEAGLLTQLLAELTSSTPNQPAVRTALDELLAAALPRIVDQAVTGSQSELADLASLALQLAPQPGLAARLADQMPGESVRLAGLAVTLADQQVAHYRAGTGDGAPDARGRLAGALINLSRRLAALGRPEDALAASGEAVGIYRELDTAGSGASQADVASSLTIQSNHLAALGRRQEALASVNEAVEIYRQLAAAGPGLPEADLARSLAIQSNHLAALGRRQEALAPVNEAVETCRRLAAAGSDVLEDLAKMLSDRSVILVALGLLQDALGTAREAVQTYRRLAAARPDAFEPDLAKMLNNESSILLSLNQRREALGPINQAVEIYQRLAEVRPTTFAPDLARMLANQSTILAAQSGRQEAMEAASSAAQRMIARREQRPGAIPSAAAEVIRPARTTDRGAERARIEGFGRLEDGLRKAGDWYLWGPYVSERQWGTVREDYSADGDAWAYLPHDHARSRAFRWGEDGLAGFCDIEQRLCLGLALWNGRDPILKERIFGLASPQGNHGEDAKEYWWYLDAVPSHAWNRWRYHYPQAAFPYQDLVGVNLTRNRTQPEYELTDTGVFDGDRYWITDVNYAKADPADVLMVVTVTNAGPEADTLHVLPTAWFRNTWSWDLGAARPVMEALDAAAVRVEHPFLGTLDLVAGNAPDGAPPTLLFCENETNVGRLWGAAPVTPYPKDGINDHVIRGAATVNPDRRGTKCAFWYTLEVPPGATVQVRLRLRPAGHETNPAVALGAGFEQVLARRRAEADEFYAELTSGAASAEEADVMRQACSSVLWSKQFYDYDMARWLDGDPALPPPPAFRRLGRNSRWRNFSAFDIMAMPDKWEYPWFAAWDLAFHCVALAHLDPAFAKYQLILLCREWFQHPGGALPAFEWDFSDVTPPVQAWAALEVFAIDGGRDLEFLSRVFDKLLVNFTWWLNREDAEGNTLLEGGILGLDIISPVDPRGLPAGTREQSDSIGWLAFYAATMGNIAAVLDRGGHRPATDLVLKFMEHFAAIADVVDAVWDDADSLYYDRILTPGGTEVPVRARSLVSMIPMLAAAVIDEAMLDRSVSVGKQFAGLLERRGFSDRDKLRDLGVLRGGNGQRLLLSVIGLDHLEKLFTRLFDEAEFMSPHGLRTLSAYHRDHPYVLYVDGREVAVGYEPAEATTPIFGGNSNWRGPLWLPLNYLVITSLERYHQFFGDDLTLEYPTGSGRRLPLNAIAADLRDRLISIFLVGPDGRRPCFGRAERLQTDPAWKDNLVFSEYFDGDSAAGLGASHQAGTAGLIADLIRRRRNAPPVGGTQPAASQRNAQP